MTMPSKTLFPTIRPIIHKQPSEIYETVFSLPVEQDGPIQYFGGGDTEVLGPKAIAILPDDSFLIAVNTPHVNHLLHFDQNGRLLNTIELNDLGILNIEDFRVKETEVFLLERHFGPSKGYRVHHLSLNGDLLASEEIPYEWPIEEGMALGVSLTGIAIDCDGNVLLEVAGEIVGGYTLRLIDVLNNPGPSQIPNGYPCNDKLYRPVASTTGLPGGFKAGNTTYETQLTDGWGGLGILDVFQDGSLYLVREDVVNQKLIQVDQTVHYIDLNGAVNGMARIPLSEFYYPVTRKAAINSKGEVFVLLPRPDSLDVVRLNFYDKLDPLTPNAVAPNITINSNDP